MHDHSPQVYAVSADDHSNLGNVLLQLGACTMDKLREAVRTQRDASLGEGQKLGAVLIAMGAVGEQDVDCALRVQDALRRGDTVEAHIMMITYNNTRTSKSLDRQERTVEMLEGMLEG